VNAPWEEQSDDSKNSFYEELEQVFHNFSKYHVKILLEDFNENLGREDIFKPTFGVTFYIRILMIMVLE